MSPVTPPAALALDRVTKRFGDHVAVDAVSLQLAAGELVALVGPSGCGKSTLLRLAAGLAAADSGTIEVGGTTVDDGRHHLPPERRRVGLVFQEHALFPHLSVERNVAFGLERERSGIGAPQARRTRAARDHRVDEVLSLVGLEALRSRFPHELSGGERQRVALARAVAPGPSLLLLDEPFASLDPNLRTQIRHDVVNILEATGTAAVFVTHDQTEAMAVGHRVAVMRAGRLEQVGDPWTVFHRPANTFVASFMGEASFLAVEGGPSAARSVLGPVELGSEAAGGVDAHVAMVRPDDLVVDAAPDGPGVGGAVRSAEFRGSSWRYELVLDAGPSVVVACSHLVELTVGERVEVALAAGHRQVAVRREAR
ncbi:MAG: ABC transporter ATP-binding protein [Acidimicrobiia bacterium]|nr:ABC transporter ATP-binding protein [Acidimicrobiia bacterium]